MIFILLLATILAQAPGRLEPGTGIVTGAVQVAGGGSAAGVRVGAIATDDQAGTNLLSIAETDSAGRYRLSNLPEGRYYIVAGRLNNPTYYPGGTDRTKATEVVVEAARTVASVNFTVPAESKRPPPQPLYQPSASSFSSPEEFRAYQQVAAERNVDSKASLLLSFEKSYPQSRVLPEIYTSLMDLYVAKGDPAKAALYGEKALKKDPSNVSALLQLSRSSALLLGDLGKAIQYAERAVTAASKMKAQAPPASYDARTWQNWVATLDASATSNLSWVKQMAAWQQDTLLKAITRRR